MSEYMTIYVKQPNKDVYLPLMDFCRVETSFDILKKGCAEYDANIPLTKEKINRCIDICNEEKSSIESGIDLQYQNIDYILEERYSSLDEKIIQLQEIQSSIEEDNLQLAGLDDTLHLLRFLFRILDEGAPIDKEDDYLYLGYEAPNPNDQLEEEEF